MKTTALFLAHLVKGALAGIVINCTLLPLLPIPIAAALGALASLIHLLFLATEA